VALVDDVVGGRRKRAFFFAAVPVRLRRRRRRTTLRTRVGVESLVLTAMGSKGNDRFHVGNCSDSLEDESAAGESTVRRDRGSFAGMSGGFGDLACLAKWSILDW